MAANTAKHEFGDEPTAILPAYRTVSLGQCSDVLIHVTPQGHHTVELDCDGVCLTCNHPLESWS